MLKTSLLRKSLILAGALGVATASQAVYYGTVDATYLGPVGALHGHNQDVSMTGGLLASSTFNASVLGFLRWDQTGGTFNARGLGGADVDTPGDAIDFYTICGQDRGISNATSFDVFDSYNQIASVARGGAVVGQNFGGVTAFRDAFFSNDGLRAAGFQLAVWAGVYGLGVGPASYAAGVFSVGGAGDFTATSSNPNSNWDSIGSWAVYYYNAAFNNSFGGNAYYFDAHAGTNRLDGSQDQYTEAVPEPFTAAIGIAGVAAYLRRRKSGRAS